MRKHQPCNPVRLKSTPRTQNFRIIKAACDTLQSQITTSHSQMLKETQQKKEQEMKERLDKERMDKERLDNERRDKEWNDQEIEFEATRLDNEAQAAYYTALHKKQKQAEEEEEKKAEQRARDIQNAKDIFNLPRKKIQDMAPNTVKEGEFCWVDSTGAFYDLYHERNKPINPQKTKELYYYETVIETREVKWNSKHGDTKQLSEGESEYQEVAMKRKRYM